MQEWFLCLIYPAQTATCCEQLWFFINQRSVHNRKRRINNVFNNCHTACSHLCQWQWRQKRTGIDWKCICVKPFLYGPDGSLSYFSYISIFFQPDCSKRNLRIRGAQQPVVPVCMCQIDNMFWHKHYKNSVLQHILWSFCTLVLRIHMNLILNFGNLYGMVWFSYLEIEFEVCKNILLFVKKEISCTALGSLQLKALSHHDVLSWPFHWTRCINK